MHNFITIDTDNAVIRFYRLRAMAAGMTNEALAQLESDLETLAAGVSYVTGATFRVVSA